MSYKQNRIEAFLEKLKNLTKEDIEAIDAEYSDFICRTNITIDKINKPSRRYNCVICNLKCRTNNKEAGTKTLCGACERIKFTLEKRK